MIERKAKHCSKEETEEAQVNAYYHKLIDDWIGETTTPRVISESYKDEIIAVTKRLRKETTEEAILETINGDLQEKFRQKYHATLAWNKNHNVENPQKKALIELRTNVGKSLLVNKLGLSDGAIADQTLGAYEHIIEQRPIINLQLPNEGLL